MTLDPDNPFTKMQQRVYAEEAAKWSPENRDPVVGCFDAHNAWADYDLLFEGLDTQSMVALDFGCGPGRMIAKYADRFKKIDGADIEAENLINALEWFDKNCAPSDGPGTERFGEYLSKRPSLYLCSGLDLRVPQEVNDALDTFGISEEMRWKDVPDSLYDLVYSTICLQHIPVHAIRLNLFREFFRVLKPGGWFTAQMGYGDAGDPRGVDYYADKWDADATNGGCDVKVTSEAQLRGTLLGSGFLNSSFTIRPTGPGDWHPNWIWFRAQKPL